MTWPACPHGPRSTCRSTNPATPRDGSRSETSAASPPIPSGNLIGTASGSDPYIGNDNFFALERDSERILVRMKVDSGSRGDIYLGNPDRQQLSVEARKFTWTTTADNNFHIYDIDTLDHAEWNGQIIRRIRLDPTNVGSGSFELDYILTGKRGDFDQDGISDIDEGIASQTDTDGDHIPDFADTDSDNDGIPDSEERLPFFTWINSFTSLTDPNDKLPGADPDSDGLNNLGEFAFGGNPSAGADKGPVHSEMSNDRLIHTIAVRNGASALFATSGSPLAAYFDGVNYTVAGSKDLTDYTATVNKRVPVVLGPLAPAAPAGCEYVTFELDDAVSIYPKGFLRATATSSP